MNVPVLLMTPICFHLSGNDNLRVQIADDREMCHTLSRLALKDIVTHSACGVGKVNIDRSI